MELCRLKYLMMFLAMAIFLYHMKASLLRICIGMSLALFSAMISYGQSNTCNTSSNYSIRPENGIYRSANDFACGYLLFPFANRQANYKWQNLSLEEKVTLITLDTIVKADEMGHWGYRINKKDYRFYNNQTYTVVAQNGLIIYEKQYSGGEYSDLVFNYFSLSASSPIQTLTRKNVVAAFDGNIKMVQSLRSLKRTTNWIKLVPPNNWPLLIELYLLNK
jgi:hypothetical protein